MCFPMMPGTGSCASYGVGMVGSSGMVASGGTVGSGGMAGTGSTEQ